MEEQEREEHHQVAEQYQDEADRIQRPSEELKEEISDVGDDWEQKTKAEAVPGAMELPDEDEPEPNKFEYEERTTPEGQSDEQDEDEDDDDSNGDGDS
jgi:hypothetical protein